MCKMCVCLHTGLGVCFLARVHHACLSVRLHVRVCVCVASATYLLTMALAPCPFSTM